jgi:hypothetical protein
VLADADLEHRAVVIDNRTRDLEAEHLSAQDAVLDDRFGAGGTDHLGEGFYLGIERWLGRQWRGRRLDQLRAVDPPHRRWIGEGGRPPSQGTGSLGVIDKEVEVLDREAMGPQEGLAEAALGLLVGENPCSAVLDERGAAGKALGSAVALAPTPPYEGAQLGLAKGRSPLVLDYFLFPLRAP